MIHQITIKIASCFFNRSKYCIKLLFFISDKGFLERDNQESKMMFTSNPLPSERLTFMWVTEFSS